MTNPLFRLLCFLQSKLLGSYFLLVNAWLFCKVHHTMLNSKTFFFSIPTCRSILMTASDVAASTKPWRIQQKVSRKGNKCINGKYCILKHGWNHIYIDAREKGIFAHSLSSARGTGHVLYSTHPALSRIPSSPLIFVWIRHWMNYISRLL